MSLLVHATNRALIPSYVSILCYRFLFREYFLLFREYGGFWRSWNTREMVDSDLFSEPFWKLLPNMY